MVLNVRRRPTNQRVGISICLLLILGTGAGAIPPSAERRAPSAGRQSPDAKRTALQHALERRLEQIADTVDGVMGYEVLDLTTGARFGRLQNEVFPVASTIKLAIAYELFKQADEGRLHIDEPLALERRHVVGGAGILQQLTAPRMSLRDYATLMILLSDNTATNVVLDAVGINQVTARMSALGLRATRLRRRMMDMEAARAGHENVSTPGEINSLLSSIHRGDGLSESSRNGLLRILKMGKSSPMRRSIPAAVELANKPGGLEGVAADAGIVYVPRRPYAFSATLTYLSGTADGDAAIEAASRAVYDYFVRMATSSEYGRAIR